MTADECGRTLNLGLAALQANSPSLVHAGMSYAIRNVWSRAEQQGCYAKNLLRVASPEQPSP